MGNRSSSVDHIIDENNNNNTTHHHKKHYDSFISTLFQNKIKKIERKKTLKKNIELLKDNIQKHYYPSVNKKEIENELNKLFNKHIKTKTMEGFYLMGSNNKNSNTNYEKKIHEIVHKEMKKKTETIEKKNF